MDQSLINEFRWLVDTEAAALLRLAQDDFLAHTSPLKIAKNLRSSTSHIRAALVMEQAQLRIRARQKFPLADEMFFTKRGLEQSSGMNLSHFKAKQFTEHESAETYSDSRAAIQPTKIWSPRESTTTQSPHCLHRTTCNIFYKPIKSHIRPRRLLTRTLPILT